LEKCFPVKIFDAFVSHSKAAFTYVFVG
jgi:hypothetical protein